MPSPFHSQPLPHSSRAKFQVPLCSLSWTLRSFTTDRNMPSKRKKNKRRMRRAQAQRRALEEQHATAGKGTVGLRVYKGSKGPKATSAETPVVKPLRDPVKALDKVLDSVQQAEHYQVEISGDASAPTQAAVVAPEQTATRAPTETAVEAPAEAPIEVSAEEAVELSVKESVDLSAEESQEAPTEITAKAPEKAAVEVLAEAIVEVPAEESVKVLAEEHVDSPAEESVKALAETAAEASAQAIVEAPAEETAVEEENISPPGSEMVNVEAEEHDVALVVREDSAGPAEQEREPETETESKLKSDDCTAEADPESAAEAASETAIQSIPQTDERTETSEAVTSERITEAEETIPFEDLRSREDFTVETNTAEPLLCSCPDPVPEPELLSKHITPTVPSPTQEAAQSDQSTADDLVDELQSHTHLSSMSVDGVEAIDGLLTAAEASIDG
ncbi:hypothetical protein MHYP_G00347120 [Metynnis hypsauchen]